MNIVTGQNNAGKTALLQALGLQFNGSPHLSKASVAQPGSVSSLVSQVFFTLSMSGDELHEIADVVRTIQIAEPTIPNEDFVQTARALSSSPNESQKLWQAMVSLKEIHFQAVRSAYVNQGPLIHPCRNPSHGLFHTESKPGHNARYIKREVHLDGTVLFSISYEPQADLLLQLWPQIINRIYRFTAERFGLADSVCGDNKALSGNASNLAEVLLNLRANPGKYEQYVGLINEIMPQVKWVDLEPIPGNQVRVKVWSIEKSTMRADLAIPLQECGTGIGQVLAIVYVAFTSEHPRVLLIDEPQSFLHPGAVRKLIEVLRRFPHHQYIISTHSASVISASGSPEILILEANDGISSIKSESVSDTRAMQQFLEALGARLSDVFGMDRVIWVEGPTEEKAIPLLLEKMNEPMAGTAIVSVRNTGDLEGKDKRKAFEIYNSLTGKASILPKKVIFILDREARTDQDMQEIIRLSGGRASFIPRRTFENFILHPAAICTIANEIDGFSETELVSEGQISECLQRMIAEPRFWEPYPVPNVPSLEARELHGARLLESLFSRLSENVVRYDKTKHSVAIFSWLVEHDRASVVEIEDFLRSVLHA